MPSAVSLRQSVFPHEIYLCSVRLLQKTCYFPVQHNSLAKGHQINRRIRIPCPSLKLPILTTITSEF